ncbi:MAG: MBL fold metallo-hydrolase [Bacteroidota bacterium]
MIQVKSFVFNPFMENTYVLYDETKEAIIIDPGCYENHEKNELTSFIKANSLKVVRLLNTHCHIDHVFGNQFVKDSYDVKLAIHKEDLATLKAVKAYAPSYGFSNYTEAEADDFLEEGDTILFGKSKLDIVFVPGHAPGHVAFFNKDEKICIGGDVLFNGSIGRTDLPGGDFDTLIKSIHEKMFPLGDDMVVYCGHGPETTIGHEKKSNPFCALA